MSRYEGLDARLKMEVVERDNHRCRWCGATNRGVDAHHIRYRRGTVDDAAWNLISLCRLHHGFVHGTPLPNGDTIAKRPAQEILYELVRTPGVTGAALWRAKKRREREGLEPDLDICQECGNDHVCEGYRFCSECLEAGAESQ